MPAGPQSAARPAPTKPASTWGAAAPVLGNSATARGAPLTCGVEAHGNAAVQRYLNPQVAPAAAGEALAGMEGFGEGVGSSSPPDDPLLAALCGRMGIVPAPAPPPVPAAVDLDEATCPTNAVIDDSDRFEEQEADLWDVEAEFLGYQAYKGYAELSGAWSGLQEERQRLLASFATRRAAGETVDEAGEYRGLHERTERAGREAEELERRRGAEERQRGLVQSVLTRGVWADKEIDFDSSVDVPMFLGLLANFALQGEGKVRLFAEPSGDVNMLKGSLGQVKVGWNLGGSASGSVGIGVGLGAGTPGVLSAGVRGMLTGELSGEISAGVNGQIDLGKAVEDDLGRREIELLVGELTAEIKAEVSLTVTGSVQPYMKLGGEDLSWDLPLASYELASCEPKLGVRLPPDEGKPWCNLDPNSIEDSLKFNHPAWADEGIQSVLSWLDGEDDRAHDLVHDAQKAGILETWTTSERARLFAEINDGLATDSHEGSMLGLLQAERSVEGRWELLRSAWRAKFGDRAEPTRQELRAWAGQSMDDSFWGVGHDNQTTFDELMR
jgi:hypothetical protein